MHFCEIDLKDNYGPAAKQYYFILKAKNELGEISRNYTINHWESVIPDPVENLTESYITENSVVLNWTLPYLMRTFPKGKIINIIFMPRASQS